ncbi:phage baseplate protein [Acinetobacter guillouiae]|uniref:phage baseplate protein n=1 Tax=Acinetobacter TaxID=469 RepID=UPI002FD98294
MSINTILNTALGTVAASPLTEIAGSLLLAGRGRTIMGLFADVTIEEKHKDELVITEHPTEVGSPMADHAYKEPPEVIIKVGWSESAGKLNGLVGDSLLSETTGLVAVYETLQQLQNLKQLLVISTGKRLYSNMLIKSLGCTTDLQTENVLMIEMTLKKVFLVQSSETIVLLDNQTNPATTAGVSNGGTVQATPVNESTLSKIATGIFGS